MILWLAGTAKSSLGIRLAIMIASEIRDRGGLTATLYTMIMLRMPLLSSWRPPSTQKASGTTAHSHI